MKNSFHAVKPVQVRSLAVGEGIPKICVPIGGLTGDKVLDEAAMAVASNADLVEWRTDFLEIRDAGAVCGVISDLREGLEEMPLMISCRFRVAGGGADMTPAEAGEVFSGVIKQGKADLVDIGLDLGEKQARRLAAAARKAGLTVVVSHHDPIGTPPREELLRLLRRMRACGADLPRLGVTPHCFNDILILLSATEEFVAETAMPIISTSMSRVGSVSRLLGEVCGSAISFGSMRPDVPEDVTPGVDDLRAVLNILHKR